MVRAVAGAPMPVHLALWHGPDPALVLSLATFALGGLALPRGSTGSATGWPRVEPRLPRTEGWYDAALAGLARAGAAAVTGAVQNGRMTSYLRTHLPRAWRR